MKRKTAGLLPALLGAGALVTGVQPAMAVFNCVPDGAGNWTCTNPSPEISGNFSHNPVPGENSTINNDGTVNGYIYNPTDNAYAVILR
jgi:hypothetical protein